MLPYGSEASVTSGPSGASWCGERDTCHSLSTGLAIAGIGSGFGGTDEVAIEESPWKDGLKALSWMLPQRRSRVTIPVCQEQNSCKIVARILQRSLRLCAVVCGCVRFS